MAIPSPRSSNDEDPGEGDLTTTAQVLSAREILDRLESDAAEERELSTSRSRRPWWRIVLDWIGPK